MDAGLEGCRKERMQVSRDSGATGCWKRRIQDRRTQERMDAGKVGCRTGGRDT